MTHFDFIIDEHERMVLNDAYNAITLTENWDFVKQDCNSFMFSNSPKIWEITNKMKYTGHSGASFGCVMRTMQYIAQNGMDAFVKSRQSI